MVGVERRAKTRQILEKLILPVDFQQRVLCLLCIVLMLLKKNAVRSDGNLKIKTKQNKKEKEGRKARKMFHVPCFAIEKCSRAGGSWEEEERIEKRGWESRKTKKNYKKEKQNHPS